MKTVFNAFEIVGCDISELKKLDKSDMANVAVKPTRVKTQKILTDIIKLLQKASDGGGITHNDFEKVCNRLEKHAAILKQSGAGDFRNINRQRAGATVGNFIKKLGYEMATKKIIRGTRLYEIRIIEK